MSTPAADQSMHGSVAQVGDFRIESSSSADHATGHSLEDTAKNVIDSYAARAKGEETPVAESDPTPVAAVQAVPDNEPGGDEDGEDKAPGATPPKKGSLRWRHDELRSRVHAATREFHEVNGQLGATRGEIAAAETRLAELKTEAETLAKGKTLAPAVTAAPATDDPMPEWEGENGYDKAGKSFTEYERDREKWMTRNISAKIKDEIRSELTAEQQQRAEAEKATRASADREAETRRFDAMSAERVKAMVDELNNDPEVATALQNDEFLDMPRPPFMSALLTAHAQRADVLRHLAMNPADGYAFASLEMTQPIMEAFKSTDDPVRLLSALANNIPEAQRIARYESPYYAMKALAALELSSEGAKSGTPSETPRQPVATPLPAKLGGRSAAHVSSLADIASSTDHFDEYARRRLAGEDVSA